MNNIHKFYLVVEGQKDGYPNYKSAKLHFINEDPAEKHFSNLFICSPLFSLKEEGVNKLPKLENGTKIIFLMVPTIYPALADLMNEFAFTNEAWFSLGLANLIIIENKEREGLAEQVVNFLKHKNNLTAFETWVMDNHHLKGDVRPNFEIIHNDTTVSNIHTKISDKLPLYLKFAVSEYIISINKFLTASKKYTPQYYKRHLRTIQATLDLINDVSFLHGDKNFVPSEAILSVFDTTDPNEAYKLLDDDNYKIHKEDLINDRHGMIVQFNSSMSYIYSQAYSGTFPIFDHIGIIRRHSLLGVGTAISSLFELIIQLEEALFQLPFEDLEDENITNNKCPSNYFQFFINPDLFNANIWENDSIKLEIKKASPDKGNPKSDSGDFFNRLSFFSGRLGFREYEFSATSAIQVLVESHSLQWNIINYTHEIIHNHVRMILNNLTMSPKSIRKEDFNTWIQKYREIQKNIHRCILQKLPIDNVNYKDYFISFLIKFCIASQKYGSLSIRSNLDDIINSSPTDGSDVKLLYAPELKELLEYTYKDVTEVFVHVIDFSYIYRGSIDEYLLSIWTSWSTVPAVANDLKQYIIRSLIIIALLIDGTAKFRYERGKEKFKDFIHNLNTKNIKNPIFERISFILNDVNDDLDLKYRFFNCITVADLVYNFFVGRLENFLDNEDQNRMPTGSHDEEDNLISYNIRTNSFAGEPIRSKVRFLLDQLNREISRIGKKYSDDQIEKTSAWLLLSLSSFHLND